MTRMYDVQYHPRPHRHPKSRLSASPNSYSCSTPNVANTYHAFSPCSLGVCAANTDASPVVKPLATVGCDVQDQECSLQALVGRFSALESEVRCLLKGKDSLRDRIDTLGSKQESTRSAIENLESNELDRIRNRMETMEKQARSRIEYLDQLRKDRIRSLEEAKNVQYMDTDPPIPLDNYMETTAKDSQPGDKVEGNVLKRIVSCWDENNCELHIRRIVQSSRQIAAYEILEFAHKRLSTHLINHISETARGLFGDDKTNYLAQFIKNGPFKSKPVGEGTYGELLRFIQHVENPSKDLLMVLQAAEDSLVDEAVKAGYKAYDVGDVRSQMTGFFTSDTVQTYGRYCCPYPLADTVVTSEIVEDTRRAAEQGKLGALQKASKLIKLGCYFLKWQLAASES